MINYSFVYFIFNHTEGFIVLAIESFWTRLFSQYFVCNDDDTRDDLLFYVKGKNANKDGKIEKEQAEVIATSCKKIKCGSQKEIYTAFLFNQ